MVPGLSQRHLRVPHLLWESLAATPRQSRATTSATLEGEFQLVLKRINPRLLLLRLRLGLLVLLLILMLVL